MSRLTRETMASPTAVREWCLVTCASYPGVEIKNTSTSFRDGLAFCAIIHKHRPDLIDFSSLSKDNAYHNNKLAFETAERRLGIPALLDPKDMVSTREPDCLSVITYLSQYYLFFNRKSYAGLASLRSSPVTFLNNLKKSKSPDGLKHPKSLTPHLKTSRGDCFSAKKPHTVCFLCFKPVHLIQRHLTDGKVYHRSCIRCTVCTQGRDDGSLICAHHTADLSQHVRSAESQPARTAGYLSLGGLAVTSVPHYTKKTQESQDRLVCKTPETEGRERREGNREPKDGENRDSPARPRSVKKPALPHLPLCGDKCAMVEGPAPTPAESKIQREATETQEPFDLCAPCVTEGRPVPAPRRVLDSVVPVPAPRTKPADKCSPNSSHIPKVHTKHPWITIVHPGPWTQLPPAASPVPTPRAKTVSKPSVPPPNPFGEEADEDTQEEVPADQTQASGNDGDRTNKPEDTDAAVCSGDGDNSVGAPRETALPRSLSVPAIASAPSQRSLLHFNSTEATDSEQDMSCQSKLACKENPFDRKPAMPKSKTCQAIPPPRAAAPGHGFPLIKRKVQTDQNVSTKDLQVEIRQVDGRLQELEQRGVELERNLRGFNNAHEEEHLLMEWFSLFHQRHVLLRREAELLHLTKQQKLEERQADVEYELRCLLNKPESDWSWEDRGREQQLMDELVAVIEQRNQIVSSLDQDRQREREEDMLLDAMMKNVEFQKEGLKELKKSKGKFKPTKMFKMLNRAESTKDSADKKS